MRCGVFSGEAAEQDPKALVEKVKASPEMAGADLVGDVSTKQGYVVEPIGEHKFTVAAYDLGIKSMTPHRMAERGARVHVLSASAHAGGRAGAGAGRLLHEQRPRRPGDHRADDGPDRAGGPGPADPGLRDLLRQPDPRPGPRLRHLQAQVRPPRHQPAGAGPRRPARSRSPRTTTGSPWTRRWTEVTDTQYGRVEVSHVCLNDDVVEGLRALDVPAFSVQYHPEAAAGPHDAAYLFDRFADLMAEQPRTTQKGEA